MIFSRPGTTIMEFLCRGRDVYMPFRLMAMRLGMRYYASETTSTYVTPWCAMSDIEADIVELRFVLESIAGEIFSNQ